MRNGHRLAGALQLWLLTSLGIVHAQPAPDLNGCRQGFVWREAFAGDLACVPPPARDLADADNAQRTNRLAPATGSANTCHSGYVWRDAFPGDLVCVTPAIRDQAAIDNSQDSARRAPATGGPLGTSNVCRAPYVWRLARPRDFVCVTAETRAQVRRDNAAAGTRRGSESCVSGFVWREANALDHVCVTPATRAETKVENDWSYERSLRACSDYAATAVSQESFRKTVFEGTGRCASGDSARWNLDSSVHFNRCAVAPLAETRSEQKARTDYLSSCTTGPPPGSSGGGPPGPSQPKCCWLPSPGAPYSMTRECGPRCP